MPALYPMMAAPEDFCPGECVRKWVTEWNLTPFVGVVTQIAPVAGKVWVQWPTEVTSESPETLLKVIPAVSGMPIIKDLGYNSWEKTLSEQNYGHVPKQITATEKMALRIAHTFATDVIGKLVDDICGFKDQGLTDVQTYNRVFAKYGSVCSDHILRLTIGKIYPTQG